MKRINLNLFTLILILLIPFIGKAQAPLLVPGDEYAFQFTGDADVGLYFSQTLGSYQFMSLTGTPQFSLKAQNGNAYMLGNVAIGLTSTSAKFQVMGVSRFGDVADRAQIDAAGNLRFFGSANYLVGNNQYAFKYSGGLNGLFFNTSDLRYDFRNNIGDRVFSVSVDAAGDGNIWMHGDGLVNGNGSSNYSFESIQPDSKSAALYAHNSFNDEGAFAAGGPVSADYSQAYLGVLPSFLNEYLPYYPTNISVLGLKGKDGSSGVGVYGFNNHSSGINYAGYFTTSGMSSGTNYGIYAKADSGAINYAGYFVGDVNIEGDLTVSGNLTDNDWAYFSGNGLDGEIYHEGDIALGTYTDPDGHGLNVQNYSPGKGAVRGVDENGGLIFAEGLLGLLAPASSYTLPVALTNVGVLGLKPAVGGNGAAIVGLNEDDNSENYAGVFSTTGSGGTTNYGVWATASGATTNYAVYASGDVAYTGSMIEVSDAQLKENIQDLEDASSILLKLQPRTYEFKTTEFDFMNLAKEKQYGFIAQEIEKVIPEMVHDLNHPGTGEFDVEGGGLTFKGVSYIQLIPVLVQAFKEQNEQVEKIAKAINPEKVKAMEEEIADLRGELNELKDMIRNLDESLAQCCVSHDTDKAFDETDKASLGQNIPNPFTNSTLISYYLPAGSSMARLTITDLKGSIVKDYKLDEKGFGQVEFNNSSIGAGTYLYTLVIDGQIIDTRQMVLVR